MTEHLDAGELAQFVQGELAGAELARFEAHVADCDACAARLVDEARCELTLLALAAAPDRVAGDALEQFVTGALDGAARVRFEAHVEHCEVCAARLAREARLELALVEVAGALPARPAAARSRARAGLRNAVAALAIAAVIALVVQSRDGRAPRVDASRPMPEVTCAVRSEQAACVAQAHRHGLFVRYPTSAGPPPLAGPRSSAGPSISPSSGDAEAPR